MLYAVATLIGNIIGSVRENVIGINSISDIDITVE